MTKEKDKQEHRYPIRSLHDFLYELNNEWDRFRTGSLIGLIVSFALLLFSIGRAFSALRNRALFDLAFMIVIIGALVYTIAALLAQHRFFKRWERRIGLLLHMEEKMMGENLEKKT
jgi:hypothetical protein